MSQEERAPGQTPPGPEALRRAAYVMDNLFRVPGTRLRFGVDPLLGFFPGIGDSIAAVVSVAAILSSLGARLPAVIVFRMILNVVINGALGAVPVFGDAFSFWFKSNARNLRLAIEHAGGAGRPVARRHYVIGALALLVALGSVAGVVLMFHGIWTAITGALSALFAK